MGRGVREKEHSPPLAPRCANAQNAGGSPQSSPSAQQAAAHAAALAAAAAASPTSPHGNLPYEPTSPHTPTAAASASPTPAGARPAAAAAAAAHHAAPPAPFVLGSNGMPQPQAAAAHSSSSSAAATIPNANAFRTPPGTPLAGGALPDHATLPPPSASAIARLNRDPALLTVCNDLPPHMDRPAWRIEDYTLIQKIHAGYASAVYKAFCRCAREQAVITSAEQASNTSLTVWLCAVEGVPVLEGRID